MTHAEIPPPFAEQARLVEDASRREMEYGARATRAILDGLRLAAAEISEHAREDTDALSGWMDRFAAVRSLDEAVRVQGECAAALWGRLLLKQARMTSIFAGVARDLWEPARQGAETAADYGERAAAMARREAADLAHAI